VAGAGTGGGASDAPAGIEDEQLTEDEKTKVVEVAQAAKKKASLEKRNAASAKAKEEAEAANAKAVADASKAAQVKKALEADYRGEKVSSLRGRYGAVVASDLHHHIIEDLKAVDKRTAQLLAKDFAADTAWSARPELRAVTLGRPVKPQKAATTGSPVAPPSPARVVTLQGINVQCTKGCVGACRVCEFYIYLLLRLYEAPLPLKCFPGEKDLDELRCSMRSFGVTRNGGDAPKSGARYHGNSTYWTNDNRNDSAFFLVPAPTGAAEAVARAEAAKPKAASPPTQHAYSSTAVTGARGSEPSVHLDELKLVPLDEACRSAVVSRRVAFATAALTDVVKNNAKVYGGPVAGIGKKVLRDLAITEVMKLKQHGDGTEQLNGQCANTLLNIFNTSVGSIIELQEKESDVRTKLNGIAAFDPRVSASEDEIPAYLVIDLRELATVHSAFYTVARLLRSNKVGFARPHSEDFFDLDGEADADALIAGVKKLVELQAAASPRGREDLLIWDVAFEYWFAHPHDFDSFMADCISCGSAWDAHTGQVHSLTAESARRPGSEYDYVAFCSKWIGDFHKLLGTTEAVRKLGKNVPAGASFGSSAQVQEVRCVFNPTEESSVRVLDKTQEIPDDLNEMVPYFRLVLKLGPNDQISYLTSFARRWKRGLTMDSPTPTTTWINRSRRCLVEMDALALILYRMTMTVGDSIFKVPMIACGCYANGNGACCLSALCELITTSFLKNVTNMFQLVAAGVAGDASDDTRKGALCVMIALITRIPSMSNTRLINVEQGGRPVVDMWNGMTEKLSATDLASVSGASDFVISYVSDPLNWFYHAGARCLLPDPAGDALFGTEQHKPDSMRACSGGLGANVLCMWMHMCPEEKRIFLDRIDEVRVANDAKGVDKEAAEKAGEKLQGLRSSAGETDRSLGVRKKTLRAGDVRFANSDDDHIKSIARYDAIAALRDLTGADDDKYVKAVRHACRLDPPLEPRPDGVPTNACDLLSAMDASAHQPVWLTRFGAPPPGPPPPGPPPPPVPIGGIPMATRKKPVASDPVVTGSLYEVFTGSVLDLSTKLFATLAVAFQDVANVEVIRVVACVLALVLHAANRRGPDPRKRYYQRAMLSVLINESAILSGDGLTQQGASMPLRAEVEALHQKGLDKQFGYDLSNFINPGNPVTRRAAQPIGRNDTDFQATVFQRLAARRDRVDPKEGATDDDVWPSDTPSFGVRADSAFPRSKVRSTRGNRSYKSYI
jgi:hypothetical protein